MKLAECHPNRKHKARGLCGACYGKWLHENNPKEHERYKEYQRSYTPDERQKEQVRWLRKSQDPKHKRQRRNQLLRRKYDITVDQYDALLESQGGGCAICTRKPGRTPLHVDHCHDTGVVRGILCHQCNWYLGTIEASVETRTKLFAYLEKADDLKENKARSCERVQS